MSETLADALPEAIAKISEFIGQQDAQAKALDALSPGMGDGCRMVSKVIRVKRDAAVSAQQSGDMVLMIHAYQYLRQILVLAAEE